ncbi:DoxX family protein [Mycolicibacterium rufum]|uniref:DoxX family protein n=1 Tax=Mycolicibacterium rufum TaxID=318424 RepID=A0A9X3BNE1_9MYCO|nr:DoxX family protein [Mycolicibacterium rufum]MCV7070317.1 DoxX family protein [Mycolicibacterium rufum]ULP39530.1 DoxX family protein [Mycolicibacterium rufum]
MQAGDAVACIGPIAPVRKALDDVGLAEELRPVLPVVKAASAVGLLSVYRFPALARLTTFMLTVYFTLAVSAHVRAKDWSPGLVAASSLLALFGAMTVQGPPPRADASAPRR